MMPILCRTDRAVGAPPPLKDRFQGGEPGIVSDDVFLVVGKRIRPGSLSAWIVAEHRAATEQPVVEISPTDDAELMAATLADIV